METLLGYLYSLSGVSKRVLGESVEPFEADLRQELLAYDQSGQYREEIRFYLILTRRPPAE